MSKTLLVTLEFPPQVGGTQKYYHNLCLSYPDRDIIVLAPPEPGASEFDKSQTYKIIRQKFLGLLWPRWFKLARTIQKIVKTENIDHILVGQILPVGSAAWLAKKPFSVFLHGKDIGILAGRKKALAQEVLNKTKKIIVNSNFTKNLLLEKFSAAENKIEIQHPAVSIGQGIERQAAALIPQLQKKYKLKGKKIILTISRLVKRKGHKDVLRAIAKIKNDWPHVAYVIVGAGEYENELKTSVKELGLENHVIFTGQVDEAEMNAWLRLCDIFTMTPTPDSRDVEGFGIIYLEAKHYQKPIITTSAGGVKEAIGDYTKVTYVNPANTDSIPNAIKNYVKN